MLCAVESIGKSYEGRDIWLVTVTNTETGAHLDKPGFLIEASIHSMEWTGCTAALHLIHKLLSEHGENELVTRALDTRTFYIIPRLNPDGAERGLQQRRFIRSMSPRTAYRSRMSTTTAACWTCGSRTRTAPGARIRMS